MAKRRKAANLSGPIPAGVLDPSGAAPPEIADEALAELVHEKAADARREGMWEQFTADERRAAEKRREQTEGATAASVESRRSRWTRWRERVAAEATAIRAAWETSGRAHTYGDSDLQLATVIYRRLPRRLDDDAPGADDLRPKVRTIRAWLRAARTGRDGKTTG